MADFSKSSTISITYPKGMIPMLKTELVLLGYVIRKTRHAGVEIEGSLEDCMFLNLTLRTAHRVHFLLKKFKANNAHELSDGLKSVEWENYIDKHGYVSLTSFIKMNYPEAEPSRYQNNFNCFVCIFLYCFCIP